MREIEKLRKKKSPKDSSKDGSTSDDKKPDGRRSSIEPPPVSPITPPDFIPSNTEVYAVRFDDYDNTYAYAVNKIRILS